MIHRFQRFEIDEDKREARVEGRALKLQPRVLDLLIHLARNHHRVVPKEELLDAVWPGVIVADGSLQRAVSLARAAFEEAGVDKIIRNHPRQGYRLASGAPDESTAAPGDPGAAPMVETVAAPIAPTPEQRRLIDAHLATLDERGVFKGAPRARAMLHHMVAAELSGQGDNLSPDSIARHLAGIGGAPESRTASGLATRLEAGDLRARLRAYYAHAGRGDPLCLELPGGRFSPRIYINGIALDARESAPKQEIRFLTTGEGVTLAYATSGYGFPLVKAANWLSHLEHDHQSPVWRHWWRSLAERYQLIRYDEPGCGLSDWSVDSFCVDTWTRDLELVVDACGLKRFALLGISQGAPVAVTYAVRHPERVSHLILYGGYAQGPLKRARTPEQIEEANLLQSVLPLGWGRENSAFKKVFASLFMPEGTPEQHRSFIELQRVSSSPENAARFVEAFANIDVVDVARRVTTPTLVMHASGDQRVPADQARLLASLIPDSRLVLLEGSNHIMTEDESAWPRFLEEVEAFLG